MNNQSLNRRQFVRAGAALSAAAPFLLNVPVTQAAADEKPALLGGKKAVVDAAPGWPQIEALDEEKFLETLRSRGWCRLGNKRADTFDQAWAEALGARHAIGTVNGTNSLYAALSVLDAGPGDEVIVPAYTFVASINAILQVFALPVFADTDRNTFQIETATLEERITDRTRAIMTVHLGGASSNMDEILRIAKKHNLPVIEDACQSHFCEWRGQKIGTLGDVGCFSFQETKILPCGEGGACVTNRDDLYDKIHAFQNNGRDRKLGVPAEGYLHQGTNLRMTEYQAALLLAQLTRLDEQCKIRQQNAQKLNSLISGIPGIRPAAMYEGNNRNTYYIYMLHYDKDAFDGLPRRRFVEALRKEGVSIGEGYANLNQHPFLHITLSSRGFAAIYPKERIDEYWKKNHCPENDKLSSEGLFMSQSHLLGSESHVEQVANAIRKVHAHAKALQA